MCGIVGLFLKKSDLRARLGALFAPMLVEMTERGPDSAGFAIFSDGGNSDGTKITVAHRDGTFDWELLCQAVTEATGIKATATHCTSHAVLKTMANLEQVLKAIEAFDNALFVTSTGTSMEIYKEIGTPQDVANRFRLAEMSGSHALGHTRMATESAVTRAGSHPFSAGPDLCLVHNGSLSNYFMIRERLQRHRGARFLTENDTEVAAAYLSDRLDQGDSLKAALEAALDDLDGFYTFVAGTKDGFAVLRDPIACKPAVLAETDDYVAFGSEYRALVGLPGIEQASVWEPQPAVVYSWDRAD